MDRVVVSLSDARGKLPMDKLLEMKLDGVSFDHLASVYEEYTGKIAVENLRPSWLIFSSGFRKSAWLAAVKRALDLVAATIGIVLAAPLMAAGRCRDPADVARARRSTTRSASAATDASVHGPQVPVDADRRRGGDRRRCGPRPTIRASRRSAASCGARGSTSCRSCGTC